jgi:hypothetical protein
LRKELLDYQLESEIKYKEKEQKNIEDIKKNNDELVKTIETKNKMLENKIKEQGDTINELLKELNTIKKQNVDESINLENKLNIVNIEKANLVKENNTLLLERANTDKELSIKEGFVIKLKTTCADIKKENEENNKTNLKSLEKVEKEYSDKIRKIENENRNLLINQKENERLIESLKQKLAKCESDDIAYSENLKKYFSEYIENPLLKNK